MRLDYEVLARYERKGFTIIVDKSWEDINPRGQFEECDVDEICRKIDDGTYDWFFLRVRALVDGNELGSAFVGGCLYEDAKEVLTDGTAEDLIEQAIDEAKTRIWPLMRKLQAINAEMERESIV